MRQEYRESIELLFRAADFESMWNALNNMYQYLGFTDKISDQQRIDEYKWIVQQLRKYMFTKQDSVMSKDTVEEMIDVVVGLIGKADEYGRERKDVVYNFMRDHWLYEVRDTLMSMLVDVDEEEEDE